MAGYVYFIRDRIRCHTTWQDIWTSLRDRICGHYNVAGYMGIICAGYVKIMRG